MSHPTKVQMKIGDAEFIAEGTEEVVNSQFQAFLNALANRAAAPPTPPPPPEDPLEDRTRTTGSNGSPPGGQISPEVLRLAYITNGDHVTLRALPDGGDESVTDSILLLLYGYRCIAERLDVTAVALTESVRASGIQTTRIDRIIGRSTLMRRAGSKRGTRYSLNNQGTARAEMLLRQMYT